MPLRTKKIFTCLAVVCLAASCVACAPSIPTQTPMYLAHTDRLPVPDTRVVIDGLSNCTHSQNTAIELNSQHPVNVIVHGCFSSAGRFRALADVFAFHGQQAICFSYDDRDSLEHSSAQLITALDRLSSAMPETAIQVIGHSQGGLIARRALITEREDERKTVHKELGLTTISAPFAGIEASSHCGSDFLAVLSLGLVKPVCQLITGSKYSEIPPNSDFILQPGTLLPTVSSHLRIATDETESCRTFSEAGHCQEDDYVFSVDEQLNQTVDEDQRTEAILVKAGHVEIVGDEQKQPTKLVTLLQDHGILRETPANQATALAELMAHLYR